jgi:uncharacterized protein YecT (DUF1311 family)
VAAECDKATSPREAVECEDLQLKTASRELSDISAQLNRVFNVQERQALQKANAAWLAYRDAHCRSLAMPYDPGSITTVISVKCAADLTRERVRILRENFKMFLELPANEKKNK